MSVDNAIPEVWAAALLTNLRKFEVYTQPAVINRDYEGEIARFGDTVRITSIGPVTVSDYVKNVDIAGPETLQDAQALLRIERAKYFNFQVDDVDQRQARPDLVEAGTAEGAYALLDAADQYVAGQYTDISPANFIGTEGAPKTDIGTPGTAYQYLVDLGVLLTDTGRVPLPGRWVIVPAWFEGALRKDDRFVKSGTAPGDALLRNGLVGEAAGFRIYISHNVPRTTPTTVFKIIAGHPMAWTYADQLNEVNLYRPEKRFADAMKGLNLFGAKVTRSDALAVLFANKP